MEHDAAAADSAEGDRVPTNLRLLMIAEIIADAGRPLTPSEINQHLGLPKPSIHRLCQTLISEGFLTRDSDPRRLQPARRLRRMASGLLSSSDTSIARHQVLMEVASKVNETTNLVVPEEAGMRYLDRVETEWAFRVQLPVGTNVPFHCTASGKTYLASLEPLRRARFVDTLKLEARTANTFTDGNSLLGELDKVAAQGYAVDNREFIDGMVAIAVPIYLPDERYFGALAFHGPDIRMNLDTAVDQIPVLKEGARKILQVLFD
jgi:DNA-binding IclR family transcriptional regulator